MIKIHKKINEKLNYFIEAKKIPNIVFYGPSGSGKRTIIYDFINKIYNKDKEMINNYVLYEDCAHGKGIKFIRNELKFFAKTNIHNSDSGAKFKSIILLNADKLTVDAQSALRRCIELFSHSTRFFIVVENKLKLLKPILSRFCDIYVGYPINNKKQVNLHILKQQNLYKLNSYEKQRFDYLKKQLIKITDYTYCDVIKLTEKLYSLSYSGLDLIKFIEKTSDLKDKFKYKLLIYIEKIRKEFRNEKLLIFLIIHFLFFRSDYNLENVAFM